MILAGKEVTFKHPTLGLSIKADDFVRGCDLFRPIEKFLQVPLAEISRTDAEQFARLNAQWSEFLDLILVEVPEEARDLMNVSYPDEVMGLQENFFTLPWANLRDRAKKYAQNSQDIKSPKKEV